jgi:hypothetical protein
LGLCRFCVMQATVASNASQGVHGQPWVAPKHVTCCLFPRPPSVSSC